MGLSDDVSTVALVVSLVALIVSVGQALQQYLSTAEGFRRCRKDVIGEWSKLTRRHFDWKSLRFETRFVSPHISLMGPQQFYSSSIDTFIPIGHRYLPARTEPGDLPSARVSWLALLDYILYYQWNMLILSLDTEKIMVARDYHATGLDLQSTWTNYKCLSGLDEYFDYLYREKIHFAAFTVPVATKRVISWDFMP